MRSFYYEKKSINFTVNCASCNKRDWLRVVGNFVKLVVEHVIVRHVIVKLIGVECFKHIIIQFN